MFEKTNNLFKLIALLLVTAMLFGMTFTVSAYEMDEALYENWEFAGGAYSVLGKNLIKVPAVKGTEGRALYIEISNNKPGSGGAVATKVNIVYYDGKYINANDPLFLYYKKLRHVIIV